MELIDEEVVIYGAAQAWAEANGFDATYRRLKRLKPPTRDAINAIIGNGSWTIITCSECGEEVDAAVLLDNQSGDADALICLDCLRKAIALFEPPTA